MYTIKNNANATLLPTSALCSQFERWIFLSFEFFFAPHASLHLFDELIWMSATWCSAMHTISSKIVCLCDVNVRYLSVGWSQSTHFIYLFQHLNKSRHITIFLFTIFLFLLLYFLSSTRKKNLQDCPYRKMESCAWHCLLLPSIQFVLISYYFELNFIVYLITTTIIMFEWMKKKKCIFFVYCRQL